MKYCSVEEIQEKVQAGEMVILDVREPYEHDISAIDAMHIPMGDIIDRLNEIPRNQLVAVMCRSGKRAEAVANILCVEHSFENIVIMEGGIIAWIGKFATHLETY
jgi:rhodanese-related sulfurtransferase